MTDLPVDARQLPSHLPSRLGTSFRLDDGRFVGRLEAPVATCSRGVVPMSALVFLVDVATGVPVDDDPDCWSFTSELTVRAPLTSPPPVVEAWPTVLRAGRRSVTIEAPLLVDGEEWGSSFASFSRIPRRPDDPPKQVTDPVRLVTGFTPPPIDEPLRSAAGFRSEEPGAGRVTVELRPDLLNPAGTLQGAMVAGLAEAAAEDLADHHRALGTDRHVVTEMQVRYIGQNRVSPIATRARFVGPPSEGVVRIDLLDDDGRGRVTTAVLARVRPAPA